MGNNALRFTDFYKTAVKLGLYTEPDRLAFYLQQRLFKNIDFENQRVIDIGGGSGLCGFYAALLGAARVGVLAQRTFSNFFKRLSDASNNDATLIISDCKNQNLFYSLGITNPLMKTIEWEKHQPPEVWANIAGKFGYKKVRTD